MRFSSTLVVSAFAAMASAQNMFTMANIPTSIAVGSTFNITWQPTTQGSVSLLLVQASSPGSTLVHQVSTIAANITNSGAFAWIPSSLTVKGSGYAVEIVDDSNPFITNYSGQFGIDSTTTASASSSAASVSGASTSATATVASTSTGSLSSLSTTGSKATSSGSSTGSVTVASTTLSTVTSSGSSSASSTSSSSSATATAKIGGATVETARSGLGLLAALGVAVFFL